MLEGKHVLYPLGLFLVIIGGVIAINRIPQTKHTQQCQFVYATGRCYWFTRPDHEFFEMCFDNPPPFKAGLYLRDITYTDDNADLRHFVKAQLP